MANQTHVSPRIRAYGKARIEIARRAQTPEEWQSLWKPPSHPFPFTWGEFWKQCIEYRVVDYPAEIGFYIDVLGFPVNAFDSNYAQFTSPDGEFFIAVVPAADPAMATPPDALRIQFMIENIEQTAAELERRGVVFDVRPQPLPGASNLYIGSFFTPHGIAIELWGIVRPPVRLTFKQVEPQPVDIRLTKTREP